jgi:hypothetical protein
LGGKDGIWKQARELVMSEPKERTRRQLNNIRAISVLVATRPKSLAFGATPGFGGDFKFSLGFGGDKKLSLLVATQKDPHLVVASTNTSKMVVTNSRPRLFSRFWW